jgi:hypothetical protein
MWRARIRDKGRVNVRVWVRVRFGSEVRLRVIWLVVV